MRKMDVRRIELIRSCPCTPRRRSAPARGFSMSHRGGSARHRLRAAACVAVFSCLVAPLVGCYQRGHRVYSDLSQRWTAHASAPASVTSARAEKPGTINAPRAEPAMPSDELTLETARAISVRTNPDVHAARARLDAASARVTEAQSRWYPLIVLTHNSTRTFLTPASRNRLSTLTSTPPSVPVDLQSTNNFAVTTLLNAIRRPLFGLGGAKGNTNPFSEHSTALTATWTIFDGFIRDAQIRAALSSERAFNFSLDDVRRVIVHAVETAYFQVQLAEEQLRISQADEVFSREQLEETEKLRRAGRASQADVGNFRVRVLAAKTNVSVAQGQRDTGRVALAELMGLTGAALPDTLSLSPLTAETDADMAPIEADPYIARALFARPDVREMAALLDSQHENAAVARGAMSPTITLSASHGFDRSQTLRYGVEDQSAAAALEVRWELYTGGARGARITAAEALEAETAARLQRLRLAVASEVRSAVIAVGDAQRQIHLQRENLLTATENRRVITAGYVAGKEALTRLNEAQRDYIAAEADLALARIRLRQAWSDLYAATADDSRMPGVSLKKDVD